MTAKQTKTARRTRMPHGEGCIACTDPVKAARQIRLQQAEFEAMRVRAREHRARGEAAQAALLQTGLPWQEVRRLQAEVFDGHGTANGIGTSITMGKGQIDRVLAAHPAVAAAMADSGEDEPQ
jgi:predicted DNA-binding protein (UPF0251 family)